MDKLQIYCFLLCIALCFGELLGPEKRPKKKTEEEEEEDWQAANVNVEENDAIMEQMKKVARDEVENLNDYLAIKLDDDQTEASAKLLEDIKGLTQKMASQASWVESIIEMPQTSYEDFQENPQDLLDQLPPLTEEKPEMTPELLAAKEVYETAMEKLDRRSPDLYNIIPNIKQAADAGYVPAKIKLAWSYVYGEGVELDLNKALEIFEALANEGNAEAHAGMGFMYSSGIVVPVSQAKALVHYTMGALGESTFAQMALAYRYWGGVTVLPSCDKALELYMKVAAKVAATVSLSGGPAVQRGRLAEEGGGGALDADLIDYYQLLADKGDVHAQVGLGQLHFQGGRGVTLDVKKAHHYFQQAANAGNAVANAFLGKIYLEGGDGVKADNETALRYFKKAAELNNPIGQSGLGIMYLQGRGVPKDTMQAFKYFTLAANQGWVEGQLHLGFMYFGGMGVRRDFKQAHKYFSLASQSGHVLAFYHLAQIHARGLGVMRSCSTAVELFKNVCERGSWSARLMSAQAAWRARQPVSAFLQYLAYADMGYELAQSNAAFLLDNEEIPIFDAEERWTRALQLWTRAANQGYSAARVKLGDYHYYGLGTRQDLEAAAHHYRIASETQHNAQAMFNLGYMHARGLGLARDSHLAKRCFDLAAEAAPDARLPAALALAALAVWAALDELAQSPLAVVFLSGDPFLSNWDLYLITALLGILGIIVYIRRPEEQPAN